MRHIILFALLMTTGCSSYTLRPDERKEVLRAIDLERCLGISQGPKLALKEYSRKEIASNGEKREFIQYFLDVTGACPGECYDLYFIRQDEGFVNRGKYRVQENQELIDDEQQLLLKNYLFDFFGYMHGEIVSLALVNCATKEVSVLVYSPNLTCSHKKGPL